VSLTILREKEKREQALRSRKRFEFYSLVGGAHIYSVAHDCLP
jgi:hypothetical protein